MTFGDGCSALAGERARELGGTRALVVTDEGVVEAGLVEGVLHALDAAGLAAVVFDGVEPNPRVENVVAARDLSHAEGCDLLVAVGGGSAIDTARLVGLLLTNGGRLRSTTSRSTTRDRSSAPSPGRLPTTSGTGSEVTFWAVITDSAQHEKLGLGGHSYCAVARPRSTCGRSTRTMPPAITTYTGLDARPTPWRPTRAPRPGRGSS